MAFSTLLKIFVKGQYENLSLDSFLYGVKTDFEKPEFCTAGRMIGQILPFQLHKIFLSRLMWTWKGQDVYVIVEWSLRAKHRQMTRNYKMVDYTTHVGSPSIKIMKRYVW